MNTNKNMMDDLYSFDVYKVYLIDEVTGLELYSDSLTDTSLQFKEEVKEIRAGVGNKLLTDIPSSKDISIEVTDVKSRIDWISAKQGTDMVTAAQTAWHLPKIYKAVKGAASDIVINLDNKPKTVGSVKFMKRDSITGECTDVVGTVAESIATFETGVLEGQDVVVNGYTYEAPAKTLAVDFDTEKFSKSFKVILEGIVFDGNRKPRFKKQYLFYKGSLDGNMEDSTKSERDASQVKTTIKIMQESGRTSLGMLMYIPIA